jgi:hypothetical protein
MEVCLIRNRDLKLKFRHSHERSLVTTARHRPTWLVGTLNHRIFLGGVHASVLHLRAP